MAISTYYLNEKDGNKVYPIAHAQASYTKTGETVQKKLDDLEEMVAMGVEWKASVGTYADITTKYPNPEDGWTVNVRDTDYTYRYDGTNWVAISANSIPLASSTVDGKMSKEDKAKLDGLKDSSKVEYENKVTGDSKVVGVITIDGVKNNVQIPVSSNDIVFDNNANGTGIINELDNGKVYLNIVDDSGVKKSIKIIGTGSTKVTKDITYPTDSNYVLKINSPSTYTGGSNDGLVPAAFETFKYCFLRGDGSWVDINMVGAKLNVDGKSGTVPTPTKNDINSVLCGDGTWKPIDSALNSESTNPVENKVITAKINEIISKMGDIGNTLDAINRKVVS